MEKGVEEGGEKKRGGGREECEQKVGGMLWYNMFH